MLIMLGAAMLKCYLGVVSSFLTLKSNFGGTFMMMLLARNLENPTSKVQWNAPLGKSFVKERATSCPSVGW